MLFKKKRYNVLYLILLLITTLNQINTSLVFYREIVAIVSIRMNSCNFNIYWIGLQL